MPSTHFVDVHVLGDTAPAVSQALKAWRTECTTALATGEGDVVSPAAKPTAALAPWPAGVSMGTTGAVFDLNGNPDVALEALAWALAQRPGVRAVATCRWDLDGEGVRFTCVNDQGQIERRILDDVHEPVGELGGVSIEEALNDDELVDRIGDRFLETFLAEPPGPLAALYAAARAQELDDRLPDASAKPRGPRM